MEEPQVWKIAIGHYADQCQMFCNGKPVYPNEATLHMEVGAPTTLHLSFPMYGVNLGQATYQPGDELMAEGTPKLTTIDIGGRRYRLIEIRGGDLDEGLFGERARG